MIFTNLFSFVVFVAHTGWNSALVHYTGFWCCLSKFCYFEPEVLYWEKWSFGSDSRSIFLANGFGNLHQSVVLSLSVHTQLFALQTIYACCFVSECWPPLGWCWKFSFPVMWNHIRDRPKRTSTIIVFMIGSNDFVVVTSNSS